jgi:hypothetical protein
MQNGRVIIDLWKMKVELVVLEHITLMQIDDSFYEMRVIPFKHCNIHVMNQIVMRMIV